MAERLRMAKNLNILNILLFVLIFPVFVFFTRDYLVYAYSPDKAILTTPQIVAPSPIVVAGIQSYASIVETPFFPSMSREFRPVHITQDGLNDLEISGAIHSMRLIGTFVGKKSSYAVIEKKGDNAEKTFRIGESVYGTGVLKEVRRDNVVISNGASDFTLAIPIDDILAEEETSKTGSADYQAARNIVWQPTGSVRKTGNNAWVIDQKAILHALDNIGQVLSDARLKPVSSKSGIEGFLVDEVLSGGIFDAIGFKNGDTLKRVNGFDMTTPEKAIQVLTGLRGQSRVEIDIIRAGKKIKLQYDIR